MSELSKKDLFNAKNAGQKIEAGMEITVVGVGSFPDIDKDGHPVTVTALKAEDGAIYTTISATINNCVDLLVDIISDEERVMVRVIQNTSNSGREFYQLQII